MSATMGQKIIKESRKEQIPNNLSKEIEKHKEIEEHNHHKWMYQLEQGAAVQEPKMYRWNLKRQLQTQESSSHLYLNHRGGGEDRGRWYQIIRHHHHRSRRNHRSAQRRRGRPG